MLLPEPMSKILVVGTKDRLPASIELLYGLENVHVVDFSPDEEGFSLGSPLPAASDASHKLLKLRSMEKDLEVDEAEFKEKVPISKIAPTIDTSIEQIETEMQGTVASKAAKQARLTEAQSKKALLEPFRAIDLDLALYKGYQNIDVMAGHVHTNPEAQLNEALGGEMELFSNPDGNFIVAFVPVAKADEAQRILVQNGFTEVPVPEGTGKPEQLASALETEISGLEKELEAVEKNIEQLREKYANTILASDEHLSIVVEKAELPLRMGASEHAFVLEAWVPTAEVDKVKKAFSDKFQDNIYIEVLEDKARVDVHESEEEMKMEAGLSTAEAVAVPMSEETPVKTSHKRTVDRFTFFTKLLSTPRYNEIDPTITVAIFFPMFFGLMVGDVGYGIPFTILGFLGLKRCTSKEWRGIATMLFYGGIWSIIFGLFLYGDMFGIEFHAAHATELSWSALLGIEIPRVLFNFGDFALQLGYYTKLGSVKILLYISLWIGVVHLLIGLCLGFYNQTIRHGLKHAMVEKLSWIMIMVGFALVALIFMINVLIRGYDPNLTDPTFVVGIVLIVIGLVMAVKGEGGKAIIELPEVMSNVLSYTRLIAIGMSKAGMALAFNFIAIELIASSGDVIMLVLGLLVFVIGHLMIFILAILSAGLHAIRLQYVELFNKFYEGGGLEFNPLRVIRKHTTEE
ncbi:MAG: V-type ATP synthase subunit I [Methanomassiliicoccus sp.]|nr:V-type ATP synthase subunit I [Methanomassiliicoccus sp.]